MNDNRTAHTSDEYDGKISKTIPFYDMFHQSCVDLIRAVGISPDKWLDTGCGTGNLGVSASKVFSDTEFTLADPSVSMLKIAKGKFTSEQKVIFINSDSQNLSVNDNTFDVITAVQSHHYLKRDMRVRAVENCFRMLKQGGVFITFENIRPVSEAGKTIGLKRWEEYQVSCGKTSQEAGLHMDRFDKEYFPITVWGHLELLKDSGFVCAELLWASYMQAGFYAIK